MTRLEMTIRQVSDLRDFYIRIRLDKKVRKKQSRHGKTLQPPGKAGSGTLTLQAL